MLRVSHSKGLKITRQEVFARGAQLFELARGGALKDHVKGDTLERRRKE